MEAVDAGTLGSGEAEGFKRRGADLRQALSYAASTGKVGVVLSLVQECGVRLADAKLPESSELMGLASSGSWAEVAYFLACIESEGGAKQINFHLRAADSRARKEIRKASGNVLVRLPYDLCVAFTKAGELGPDLFLERQRWSLPRPDKEHCFLSAGDVECQRCRKQEQPTCHHQRGRKMPEGWYSVVQYPLGDELRKAVLRRKDWKQAEKEAAARLMQSVGETLLCKAAKSQQWELVSWMLQNCDDSVELAKQLEVEWQGTWDDEAEWRARLQDREDLAQLMASLQGSLPPSAGSGEGSGRLRVPWHRGGAVYVPAGAVLRWPRLDTLKEAWELESKSPGIALEALRQVNCIEICFGLDSPLSPEARKSWLGDLDQLIGEEEMGFGTPLLHRLALAGQTQLVEQLLEAMGDPEVRNRQGLTALAVAATAGRWEAVEKLLSGGCRADGRSGALALSRAQTASRKAGSLGLSELEAEEARRATDLLDEIYKRQERPPAASLADFFQRQVRGEVMHGIEPRRFKLEQSALCSAAGAGLKVWARAVVVGSGLGGNAAAEESKEPRSVVFAMLEASAYEAVQTAEALEVGRMRLLPEEQLFKQTASTQAVAVSVPSKWLQAEGSESSGASVDDILASDAGAPEPSCHFATVTEWRRRMSRQVRGKRKPPKSLSTPSMGSRAQVIRPEGMVSSSRFAAALPVLARAPPTGSLRIESFTSCCSVAVGRVDLVVDGIRLGETCDNEDLAELEALVPPKELEVVTEMSGRQLTSQRMTCVPCEEVRVSVTIGIYIYAVPIEDEESKLEPEMMVFVAGHRRNIPEEGRPFIGSITWDSGQARLDSLRPVTLGTEDCLERLKSIQAFPDLRPGRNWSPTEWEDTSTEDCKACQFQRLLRNPVRIGNIVNVGT